MFTSQISRDEVRSAIEDKLCAHFAVTAKTATDDQVFQASAIVIREIMSRLLAVEETRCPDREVHYLSMEFLMGRSLMKNAFNLGIANALTGALEDLGRNASDIFEAENDAGLGNGGLGRLAACYMDSLATLGIPATGYSLCYELGIFRQKIVDGKQTEVADDWRSAAESWLVARKTKPLRSASAEPFPRDGTASADITPSIPAIRRLRPFRAICSLPATAAMRSISSAFGTRAARARWICTCFPRASM